jgi:hypothetical protein
MTKTAQNEPNTIRTRDAVFLAPQYLSVELNSQVIHRTTRMTMTHSAPSGLASRHLSPETATIEWE